MRPKTSPICHSLLAISAGLFLITGAGAVTVGYGPELTGVQDTQSDGTTNQMRQNINITDTVFLAEGVYRATTWDYQAAADATNGATQPVFPFITIVNGLSNHTVVAFGATIDTEPGIQNMVPFGGPNDTFVIGAGGATVAAGIQNTNAPAIQNSILTDTSFGNTDHANSLNVDEAGSIGATLDSFGHANLVRTYAFSIEVVPADDPNLTPPTIVVLNPANNATAVATGSNLVATFDEPIEVGSGNITIKNLSDATQIEIPVDDAQVSTSGPILTINPTALLDGDKEYAVQIDATAIEDTTGESFAGIDDDVTWRFRTAAADLTAPTIVALSPASGATEVATGSNLIATFDEPIVAGSGDITIKNLTDSTQIAVSVGDAQVTISGAVLTINPAMDLDLAKNYAIHIAATAIHDLADNSFAGIANDTTWAFATPIPVIGGASIGPGADITDAIENDTPNQERLNIDRTFTTLAAGTYTVSDWELNVVMSNDGTGEVTPMLLTGPPPSYTILWLGTAFDPVVDGIQTAPESGNFTLDAPADIYAGFFTTNLGSEIIGTDSDNSGTGFSSTDHDNDFLAPTDVGQIVDGFSHAALGRTYAFEINVVQGSQAGLRITEIHYITEPAPAVEFTFSSLPNRNYTVEACTSLLAAGQPGGWVELDDGVESQGTETVYTDSLMIVTGSRVYYRVRSNPPG